MSWLRLDDGFSEHPKILELTDREFRAWLRVLLYCCRYNTRGKVPVRALAALPGLTRSMLARYRDLGLIDVVDGVDVVHDFELYNGETIAVRVAKYLADHPEATANEVVKAVGGTRNIVLSEVARQRRNGLVPEEELVRQRFGGGTASEPVGGTEIGTESGTHARAPVPSSPLTTSSSTSPQDPAAVLKQLGWKPWQIEQGLRDPLRALAWANASSAARNPGGWAWAGYIAGDTPATNQQEEKPKMNVVDACQNFIESIAWDETFDEAAMREEFGRIQRKPRTEGTLTQPELDGLLEQWAATRQDRHGIPANLGAKEPA